MSPFHNSARLHPASRDWLCKTAVFLLSQFGWWANVCGAAVGDGLIGPLLTALIILINLKLIKPASAVLLPAAIAGCAGVVVEGALISSGLVSYALPSPFRFFPPVWLLCLWLLFGTLIDTVLVRLQGHRFGQAILAFIGAPLSYAAGAKLGGMRFIGSPWKGLFAIALLWAIAFPTLMAVTAKIRHSDRFFRH